MMQFQEIGPPLEQFDARSTASDRPRLSPNGSCGTAPITDRNVMIHFLKNLMAAGGLLQIVHLGAGAFSLDARPNAEGRS